MFFANPLYYEAQLYFEDRPIGHSFSLESGRKYSWSHESWVDYRPGALVHFEFLRSELKVQLCPPAYISKNSTSLFDNANYTWKKAPENFRIYFQGGYEIVFRRLSIKKRNLRSPSLMVGLAAASVHVLALFAFLSAPISPSNTQVYTNDISQLQVSAVLSTPNQPDESSPKKLKSSSELESFGLLKNWKLVKNRPSQIHSKLKRKSDVFQNHRSVTGLHRVQRIDEFDIEEALQKETKLNLTDSELADAFLKVRPLLEGCYEDLLLKDRNLKGRPRIKIDVLATGQIEKVVLENFDAKPSSRKNLEQCFRAVYQKVQLPKAPNQEFTVSQILVLTY